MKKNIIIVIELIIIIILSIVLILKYNENNILEYDEEIERKWLISKEEYYNLLTKKEGNTITKTRYRFINEDGIEMEIDIFSGKLEGLAYLEIEFVNTESAENYKAPDWVIKDVTTDLNYKNGYLARYGIPDSFFEYTKMEK